MPLFHLAGLLFAVFTWILALGWVWQALQSAVNLRRLPDLSRAANADRTNEPDRLQAGKFAQLTVVVPACNEESAIGATLRSLLASRGIRLQILAVNDRSVDRTGEIMEGIAAEWAARSPGAGAHSLQVLPIETLPPGWLGKPHALASAAARAEAEWLLFTDGDVLFAPDALARALAYVQAEQADHLVLMPDWITKSHAEAATHGAIHALSVWTLKLWRIADPAARDFLGVGAFNLVRRSAFQEIGAFDALRMEVLEDLRLGWMLKRAGYKARVAIGPGLVSVRWSEGAWGVVRNLEKNLFAVYRFRTWLAVGGTMGLVMQIAWPLLALCVGGWARWGAIVMYAAVVAVYAASRRITGVGPAYALVFPPSACLFLLAHVRSIGLALWRGGVLWRGTLYRLRDLRDHAGENW